MYNEGDAGEVFLYTNDGSAHFCWGGRVLKMVGVLSNMMKLVLKGGSGD